MRKLAGISLIIIIFMISGLVYAQPVISTAKSTYYFGEPVKIQLDRTYPNITVYYMPENSGTWLVYGSFQNTSEITISGLPEGRYAIKVSDGSGFSNATYISIVTFTLYDIIYFAVIAGLLALTFFRGPGWAILSIFSILIFYSWGAWGGREEIYFILFLITLAVGAYSFFRMIQEW